MCSSENEEAAGDGTAVAEVATVKENKWREYTSHAITVFWRLVFAVIPPECKRCLKSLPQANHVLTLNLNFSWESQVWVVVTRAFSRRWSALEL